jgi:diguanylate cyclase (GGDEF)-like protein/PAS domain S-box-containing protein
VTEPLVRFWQRLPFIGRLLIIASLALLTAAGLMLYSTARNEASEAQADLAEQLRWELDTLPAALAEPAIIGDYASLQRVLERKVRNPLIVRARYLDASGGKLVSSDRPAERRAPDWFARWLGLHDLTGRAGTVVGGRHYGDVEITLTAQTAINRLWQHTTEQLAILLAAILLDSLGIGLVLRSGLRPLQALDTAARAVADGDLAARIEPAGSPELRNSIEVFNRMAEAIEEARRNLELEKERLQVTLASIGDGVLTTDREGLVEFMNPVAEQLTGWSNAEARGRSMLEVFNIISETTRSLAVNPVERVFREGRVVELANHTLLIARDGTERAIADSAAPIRAGEGGEMLGAVLVFRDQSGERERYHQLRLSGSVFEHAQEGILITDADAIILNVNPAFTELTGYQPDEVIGRLPSLFKSGLHPPEFYAEMWATLLETGQWRGEIWNRKKNGELFAELLAITAVPAEEGGRGYYVGIFTDITELKSHQQHLEQIAHYDALTQLPNRVLLADRLQMALTQTRRAGGVLAVCYLDLDGFKPVNDTYGHETGDRLLVEVSSRLTMALRAGDTVARLGGDEFVLLLAGMPDVEECQQTLERLLKVIAKPYAVTEEPVEISASIGVSLYPYDDTDPDTLLRHADQAMYAAKESGRNRYHLFDPEHDRRARAHREAVARIEEGLYAGEFVLHYQPKVDMRRGKVVGAEALIRWEHPLRGLLAPAEFMPFIEDTEFSVKLGEWVIEQALSQMESWHRIGLDLPVSVNISARHLQQKDMTARLAAALARHPHAPPQHFELEILETSALDDILHVTRLIEECQRLGVSFSLDDFGTGYSSLSYFRRLPAETLKIDQSFVRDMLRDTEDLAIVEGVIGLAEAFRRKVIAEGVETVAHGVLLLHLGCDLAQGYGIARPMPGGAIPDWIAGWQPDPRWAEACRHEWQRQELPLLVAEFDHQNWFDSVNAWLRAETGRSVAFPNMDERSCLFGRWLDGPGQERYGRHEAFGNVRVIRRHLGILAKQMVTLKQSGHADQALDHLDEFDTLNRRLLDQLRQFHEVPDGLTTPPEPPAPPPG